MAIFQDLVDGHGFAGKYASVKRFVRKLRGSATAEARVVIQTAAGQFLKPVAWQCPARRIASQRLRTNLFVQWRCRNR